MSRSPCAGAVVVGLASMASVAAHAEPWSRGFVVDNYQPAFYFGGKAGPTDPGPDCPDGIVASSDIRRLLRTPFRTEAQIDQLLKPIEGAEAVQRNRVLDEALHFRGFRPDVNVYKNPMASFDPGILEVQGNIAWGFDLDGNAKTGGFSDEDGHRGIDNAYYRTLGCTLYYRGGQGAAYAVSTGVDHMRDGLFTIVLSISGNQDPMNDTDATLEISFSPDKIVRSPDGSVTPDYSFRVATGSSYSRLKAKITNGVLEILPVEELRIHDFIYHEMQADELVLHKPKVRLTIEKDGNLSGLIGGYQSWEHLWMQDTWNPTAKERYNATDMIGVYWAYRRNADYAPDPKTGQNMEISSALRITAVPAMVIHPATPLVAMDRRPDAEGFRKVYERVVATGRVAFDDPSGPGDIKTAGNSGN